MVTKVKVREYVGEACAQTRVPGQVTTSQETALRERGWEDFPKVRSRSGNTTRRTRTGDCEFSLRSQGSGREWREEQKRVKQLQEVVAVGCIKLSVAV